MSILYGTPIRTHPLDAHDLHYADNGCIEWRGCRNQYGYGRLGKKGRLVHRLTWERVFGEIPAGMVVMHTCDNPPCVNPEHLRVGSQKENLADMTNKGRRVTADRRGEVNGRAKLTANDVRMMRGLVEAGWPQKALVQMFDVHKAQVSAIVTRRRWAHI